MSSFQGMPWWSAYSLEALWRSRRISWKQKRRRMLPPTADGVHAKTAIQAVALIDAGSQRAASMRSRVRIRRSVEFGTPGEFGTSPPTLHVCSENTVFTRSRETVTSP